MNHTRAGAAAPALIILQILSHQAALEAAEDGSQIDGLFVCGDNSGSFFNGSYPNLLAGPAAGRSATFGRLAGRIAAKS